MPFGPINYPGFYSDTMKKFKDEWDMIFIETLLKIGTLLNEQVTVTETYEVFIRDKKLISGIRTIIDDILLLCSNLRDILVHIECVCKFVQKYCVRFWLDKCEFLKERFEYVGHDVTEDGNCPAQSKFYLINDWELPTNGKDLFSFIGLVHFYHISAP